MTSPSEILKTPPAPLLAPVIMPQQAKSPDAESLDAVVSQLRGIEKEWDAYSSGIDNVPSRRAKALQLMDVWVKIVKDNVRNASQQ